MYNDFFKYYLYESYVYNFFFFSCVIVKFIMIYNYYDYDLLVCKNIYVEFFFN